MTESDAGPFADPAELLAKLNRSRDGPVFEAPWQARAFGLVVALQDEDDGFDWTAFQRRLIDEVAEPVDDTHAPSVVFDDLGSLFEHTYYEQWLTAFERLLVEDGYLDPAEIEARAAQFADGERTAEEFVKGERHH